MKRKLSYLLVIFISMFVYSSEVGAVDCENYEYACKTCTYDRPNNSIIVEVVANANGEITLNDKHTGSYYSYTNNLISDDFYNKENDTLECMNEIYGEFGGGRNGSTASIYSTKCNNCVNVKKTSESGNDKKVGSKGKTKSCNFDGYDTSGKITVTLSSDGKKLSAVATKGYNVKIDKLTAFSIDTNCSDIIAYVHCGSYRNDKYCTISSKKLTVVPDDDSQKGDDTPTADIHNKPTNNGQVNINTQTPGKIVTSSETIKLLKRIYDTIKILVPVLIILLSVVDFLKILVVDDEKNYKSAWDKFVKRLIVGIIFFIVPILVSFLLNYSGIKTEQTFLDIFK